MSLFIMGKAEEYIIKVSKMERNDLLELWEDHYKDDFDCSFWNKGPRAVF